MDNPDMSAFSRYIPGFDFLQNLTRQAAGSVAPGLQSGVAGMPPLSQWVAPSFNPEELERRIAELRAVHFWLDQNAKALAATIQALEVQKMTLTALQGMNVSLQDVAEAFKVKPEQTQASAPKPSENPFRQDSPAPSAAQDAASAPPQDAQEGGGKPQVDPMQWWSALTQQFQTIATGAMQDMAGHAAKAAEQVAQTVQAGAQAAEQGVAQARSAAAGAGPTAKSKARKSGSAAAKADRTAARPVASRKTAAKTPRAARPAGRGS